MTPMRFDFRQARAAAYCLAVCYFSIFALSWNGQDVGAYDEFIAALGARKLLSGARPHSDFWSIYPAGSALFDAAAFRLFGESVSVQRCLQCVFAGLAAFAAMFHAFRRHAARPSIAAFVGLASLALALPAGALLTGYALALSAVLLHAAGGPRWAPPVLAAAAALCRVNFGGYAVIAILMGGGLRDIGRFAAAGLIAGGAYVLYSGAGLSEILDQTLIQPARLMSLGRFLPAVGPWPLAAAAMPGLWFAIRAAS